MSRISWLIYGAQVSNNLSDMFMTLGIIGVILVVLVLVVPRFFILIDSNSVQDYREKIEGIKGIRKGWLALSLVFIAIGIVLPNKNTVYAIAAAEIATTWSASGTGQELLDDSAKALKAWLKKQIDGETEKK